MSKIAHIEITLDNVPEMMHGVIRASSIISYDKNGNELKDHQNLIDNTEYQSVDGLKNDIAKRLDIKKFRIEIRN